MPRRSRPPSLRRPPVYLALRHKTWWAYHDFPEALRTALGQRRFAQSLGTEDKREAERKALALWLHDWKPKLEQAKRGSPLAHAEVERDAAFWRRLIKNAETEEERAALTEQVGEIAQERAEKAAARVGVMEPMGPRFDDVPGVIEAERFLELATGKLTPTTEHLEEWLSTSAISEKTKDMRRSDVRRLSKTHSHLQDVDDVKAQAWVFSLAKDEGLTKATIVRVLTAIRGYWRYLRQSGVLPKTAKPFDDLDIPTINGSTERQPFEAEDVVKLLKAAEEKDDQQLADLIALGMWSGARIEELCRLTIADLDMRHHSFRVREAKTKAGVRVVPIHPELLPVVVKLRGERREGFLLDGLSEENKYGLRSDAIGKRFAGLKRKLGFGPEHVFHSIRKTFATLLDNAGVPEGVAADIMGHEKQTMTYGVYSGGSSLATKAEAIEKVKYPLG